MDDAVFPVSTMMLIVGLAGVVMIFVVVIVTLALSDDDDDGQRHGQDAIRRILQNAEREMDLTSARHRAALDEIRWRNRHDEPDQSRAGHRRS